MFKRKKSVNYVYVIKGKLHEISSKYSEFLLQNVIVVSTAITQDFEKCGATENFILVITYKEV